MSDPPLEGGVVWIQFEQYYTNRNCEAGGGGLGEEKEPINLTHSRPTIGRRLIISF